VNKELVYKKILRCSNEVLFVAVTRYLSKAKCKWFNVRNICKDNVLLVKGIQLRVKQKVVPRKEGWSELVFVIFIFILIQSTFICLLVHVSL
jgi:hypothetical protein